MSEFEQRKRDVLAPIYFESGVALHDCQAFEYGVAFLLYLLSRLGIEGLDVQLTVSIMEDESKRTAGQLIRLLNKHVEVDEPLENGLTEGLKARNKLIHRFMIENAERIADPDQHDSLVKDIRSLRADVKRASKMLDPLISSLVAETDGLDLDAFAKEARDQFMDKTNA